MRTMYATDSGARSAPGATWRRTAILEATLRLLAKGGIDAVTHRRVAREAGVSLSSTTYYFSTREEIIHEAFRLKMRQPREHPAERLEPQPTTAPEAIDALVEWTRRQIENPEKLLAEYELVLYTARDQRLAHELDTSQRVDEAWLAAALERLGSPRPLDGARTIIGVLRHFEIEVLTRPGVRLDDLRRRLEILIPALLPHAGSTDGASPAEPAGAS